ncbi:MAG: hypothetical protein KTR25_16270 [Myxococcales bacterium]|nr:hypothetical protein [Myxococcales bacterium]
MIANFYIKLSTAATICSFCLSASHSRAEPAIELYIRDAKEVFQGDPISTSLDAQGHIGLGIIQTPLTKKLDQPVIGMAVAKDKVYLGTAGEGLIVFDSQKKTLETLFASEKLLISALTRSRKTLWFATSPKGSIYRWHKQAAEPWLSTTNTEYIWDLLETKRGELIVATGRPGRVLRVTKGKTKTVFAPEDTHIRVLHQHRHRGLIAGGGSTGIVYQLTDKGARALYDSSYEEVTALASDPKSGDLFVALVSSEKHGATHPGTWIGPIGDEEPASDHPIKGSEVVRIDSNGEVDTLWTSTNEGALSLYFDSSGEKLYVAASGYGPKARARVYVVEPRQRDRVTVLARVASAMITSMVPSATSGAILVATAPTGSLIQMGPGLRDEGIYDSVEQDLQRVSRFGRLWFDADIPPKARVTLQLRTGNTEHPDATWSDWSAAVQKPFGGQIRVPNARFAQFRTQLYRSPNGRTPRVKSMHASLQRRNLPPHIEAIYPLQPGVYLKPIPSESEREKSVTLSTSTLRDLRRRGIQSSQHPRVRAGVAPGQLTVAWEASDPNRDPLLYTAFLINEQGQELLLKDKLTVPFVSFDARVHPDGPYTMRVVASDRPLNTPANTLIDEQQSEIMIIDHSPPKIVDASVQKKARSWTVRARGIDAHSRLVRAMVSVDGEPWVLLPAVDGIIDHYSENFELRLTQEKRPITVQLQLEDASGNQTTVSISTKRS